MRRRGEHGPFFALRRADRGLATEPSNKPFASRQMAGAKTLTPGLEVLSCDREKEACVSMSTRLRSCVGGRSAMKPVEDTPQALAQTAKKALETLASNRETGLAKADAEARLAKQGPNEVPEKRSHSIL